MIWRWLIAKCVWEEKTKLGQYRRYQSWDSLGGYRLYIGLHAENDVFVASLIVSVNQLRQSKASIRNTRRRFIHNSVVSLGARWRYGHSEESNGPYDSIQSTRPRANWTRVSSSPLHHNFVELDWISTPGCMPAYRYAATLLRLCLGVFGLCGNTTHFLRPTY